MAQESAETSRLHLHTLFTVGVTAVLTDTQLLDRFATLHGAAAEAAFAAIIERHGLMVFRACRSILKDEHDARDAFQATFLILIHKRSTLWVNDSLGPWLHRVACRAALRAKVEAQRRRLHERRAADLATKEQEAMGTPELVGVLHEEVNRLPDRYRLPIVLCDLQGWTYTEAAHHLRCPVGTVRSRLARGREHLRHRLTRRGLAPSTAVVSVALALNTASAAMPAAWGRSIIPILAGGSFTAGEVSASVLAITKGALKMITLGKRSVIAAGVLTIMGLAVGAGALAQQKAVKPSPPARPTQVAEANHRWIANAPNGGTIEVLGVSTYPSGPDTWWWPDGSPRAEAPCDCPPKNLALRWRTVPKEGTTRDENASLRVVAIRVTGFPAEVTHNLSVKQASASTGSMATKGGKNLPGVNTILISIPENQVKSSVVHSASTGPWKTVGTGDGKSPFSASSKPGVSYIFGEAIAGKNGAVLTISHDIRDVAVRVAAVDRSGQERGNVNHSRTGVKDFYQSTFEFDLHLDEIQRYRLQTREYEHVEIPEVALEPNKPRK